MIDRIMLSYVRDFIFLDFWPTFPTFNIADSCLCIGAVMLAIFILFMSAGAKSEK
jgi:signal peptidase II